MLDSAPLYSLEAEQSVLGALMLFDMAWDDIADIVTAADFVRTEHRAIFAAIKRLAEASQQRDYLTVIEKLTEFSELEIAGGADYLLEIYKNCPGASNCKTYAEIIRDRAQLRRLAQEFRQGESIIADADLSLADKVSQVTERLESVLASVSQAEEGKSAKEVGRAWIDGLNRIYEAGSTITGIRTGFHDLDKAIRGLNNKHLTVIAARPSMGKSTLAVNIAVNILKSGGSVFLSTMEMSADDVASQMCAALTGCSYEALQEARMDEDSIQSAAGVFAGQMRDWKLTVDDRGTQAVGSITRGVKRHIRKHGHSVVIVDYLQLMSDKGENEVNRIGIISRGLKKLAQDLDIPVVVLSQLSRKCEDRTDKRPMLADLRGSGDIEQDASEILFLYDDSVYNPATTSGGYTELIIAKNRHGRRGIVVPLAKQLDKARFVNADKQFLPENWRGLPERKSTEGRKL